MNKIWRRILGVFCLVLVSVSLVVGPACADPSNPPIWPPVSNSIVNAVPPGTDTPTIPTTTTQP